MKTFLNSRKKYKNADFYVSTLGNDSWSGTLAEPNADKTDGPFATIERAKWAVRILRKTEYRNIFVLIRGGEYKLEKPIKFNPNDSHYEGHKIIYANYPDETPVFSSDVALEGWKLATDVEGLPECAKGKVYEIDMPALANKKDRFFTMYENGEMLTRAYSKSYLPTVRIICKDGYSNVFQVLETDRYTLNYPEGAIKNWDNLDDIEIFIQPNVGFVTIRLTLDSVDEENLTAKTKIPSTYGMGKIERQLHAFEEGSFRVENCIEDLDAPGKWVINTHKKKIYYYPLDGKPKNVTYPALTSLVSVDGHELGGIVQGIVLKGLTFTRGERDVIEADDITLQHEWECWNKANALVRFRDTEYCGVEECRFCNSGAAGVRFDLHAKSNVVTNCLFDFIGGTAIACVGYGPGKVNVNMCNKIQNNHIHHCSQFAYQSPAIMLWQSGENLVKNNLIHHIPYDAIVLSGVRVSYYHPTEFIREMHETVRTSEVDPDVLYVNARCAAEVNAMFPKTLPYAYTRNNIVEENEMFRVMLKLFDGNAIYLSDVGNGNIIRRNYVHHLNGIGMQQAIRTDAFMQETMVTENVVYNCAGGGINVKYHENHVENNIIADIRDIVYKNLDNETKKMFIGYVSLLSVKEIADPMNSEVRVHRNIFYKTYKHNPFYRETMVDGKLTEVKIEETNIDHNIYYDVNAEDKGLSRLEYYKTRGADEHSIIADPMFVDAANGNFRLKEDSPALKIGFKNIDVEAIGLTFNFVDEYAKIVREQLGDDYDSFAKLEEICADTETSHLETEVIDDV